MGLENMIELDFVIAKSEVGVKAEAEGQIKNR